MTIIGKITRSRRANRKAINKTKKVFKSISKALGSKLKAKNVKR